MLSFAPQTSLQVSKAHHQCAFARPPAPVARSVAAVGCRDEPSAGPASLAVRSHLAPSSRSRSSTVRVAAAAKAAPANIVRIIIQGRKLPVTDAIKAYVEEKIARSIHNFQHTLREVDVTLSARGGDTGTHGPKQQKVEVTIYTMRNGVVRVEDTEQSLYAAIDLVCDKIRTKMQKVKEKAIQKGRWPGKAGEKRDVADEDMQEYINEIRAEVKEFDAEEALAKTMDEINKHYPPAVMRTKTIVLDPMTVDEAIDALEAIDHDFYVFREMTSDTVQVVYKRTSGGYGVLVPRMRD